MLYVNIKWHPRRILMIKKLSNKLLGNGAKVLVFFQASLSLLCCSSLICLQYLSKYCVANTKKLIGDLHDGVISLPRPECFVKMLALLFRFFFSPGNKYKQLKVVCSSYSK